MHPDLDPQIEHAASALQHGRVVACPTEAVYGLSCDPANRTAFDALVALKGRPLDHGVLLVGAEFAQLRRFIDLAAISRARLDEIRAGWPGPVTWVFPRAFNAPEWLSGKHQGIALRLTAHPLMAALCRAFGGALVSTSANRHGQPPARDPQAVRQQFGEALAAIIDGPLGGQRRPTPIRDALTGAIIRA